MKFLFALAVIVLSNVAQAQILPKNNLHLLDDSHHLANITQEQFNEISDSVVAALQPFVEIHNAKLVVEKNWDDPTVNAYADRFLGTWNVHMFGGLARRDEVTLDGFALVVCHEIGHHLGGFPYYEDDPWAASEGEADYYATHACAKIIWGEEKEKNAAFRATVDPAAKKMCDASYDNADEQNLCYRTAMGGKSLATLLGALGTGPVPKFDTPDNSTVTSTYTGHPQAQCRLDTYTQAALCGVAFDPKVIPGLNASGGNNSVAAEQDALKYSCGEQNNRHGSRPLCWFHPAVN